MANFDNNYDKGKEITEVLVDGIGALVEPFAKRDEDDYSLPSSSYSDTPPSGDGEVIYTDSDDYDSDEEYEYIDGEYYNIY